MRYCSKCVMPSTRPGIQFNEDGVCSACVNHEKKKDVDWDKRFNELQELADKYRGCNGDYYDCIIAASSGKDSYFQIYIFKEVLKMNPLIVSPFKHQTIASAKLLLPAPLLSPSVSFLPKTNFIPFCGKIYFCSSGAKLKKLLIVI